MAVSHCPNPDCGDEVAPGDQYCEGCGQLIPRNPPNHEQPTRAVSVHVQRARSRNGSSPRHERETRGPSRARDHVELSLPGLAGVSDRGLQRSRNEDALRLGQVAERDTRILIVCDGVSSSQSAARASQAAADAALASMTARLEEGERDLEKAMTEAVAAARAAVSAIPYQPWAGTDPPSTTLVAAAVADGRVTIGWVGDSRAYFVGPTAAEQLSWDDTWAADQVALGRLSELEAAKDPRSRFLTKWLGNDQGEESPPSVWTFRTEGPGLVLLCSDGLWDYLETTESLGEVVRDLGAMASADTLARRLVDFARDAGGHDNITVAVATVGRPEDSGADVELATRSGRTLRLPGRRQGR